MAVPVVPVLVAAVVPAALVAVVPVPVAVSPVVPVAVAVSPVVPVAVVPVSLVAPAVPVAVVAHRARSVVPVDRPVVAVSRSGRGARSTSRCRRRRSAV